MVAGDGRKVYFLLAQPGHSADATLQRGNGESTMSETAEFIEVASGAEKRAIAVRAEPGASPGIVWLGGFASDMMGNKAQAVAAFARAKGRACVRFDYSGHGESGGEFSDGTIGHWLADSLAVFDAFCRGPQILVGSSMGGWIALLLARALRQRGGAAAASLAGMVLIAPAVDFTEALMWKRLPADARREIEEKGFWRRPSEYDEGGYVITKALIEDGRQHLLLDGLIETGCPVRILQGVLDDSVPWQHAVDLSSRLAQDDVVLSLIKDGDHRLSRPEDIERLLAAIAEL